MTSYLRRRSRGHKGWVGASVVVVIETSAVATALSIQSVGVGEHHPDRGEAEGR
jgi:hypothetical protein